MANARSSASSRYGSDGWGDEVVRGVQMIRRSNPLGHAAAPGMSAGGTQGVSAAPSDLALIHETIDENVALVERLKDSNEQLREYLRELAAGPQQEPTDGDADGSGDGEDDDGGMNMAALSRMAAVQQPGPGTGAAVDSDPEIEDAIRENEFIIKEKTRELNELRALLSFARCGREVRNVPVPAKVVEEVVAEDCEAAAAVAGAPPVVAADDDQPPTSMEL